MRPVDRCDGRCRDLVRSHHVVGRHEGRHGGSAPRSFRPGDAVAVVVGLRDPLDVAEILGGGALHPVGHLQVVHPGHRRAVRLGGGAAGDQAVDLSRAPVPGECALCGRSPGRHRAGRSHQADATCRALQGDSVCGDTGIPGGRDQGRPGDGEIPDGANNTRRRPVPRACGDDRDHERCWLLQMIAMTIPIDLARLRMTWRSFHRWRRGIGPRLLVRVLLFSAAITLILSLCQLYVGYRYDVRAIESRLAEIEGSYLQSLSGSLWNLDRRQIELQIEGILRLPAIRFVEVRETTDRANPLVVSGGQRQAHAAVRRAFVLVHTSRGEQEQLGVLSIEATFDEVHRALLHKAIVILISQGTTIFLVSFFILSITHRLVTRHLTALAGFLGQYALRQPSSPLRLQRRAPKEKDELDQVIAAFERMRQNLERAYGDLQESEQRFRDYAATASDWFWATGPDHAFTYFSEQADFGIDWGMLIGKRRWDIAADFASEPEHWREHMATLERREPFHDFVYTVRRVDGALGFVSISGKPVFDAEGRFTGYRGVARDITEHQRAEEALHKAQAELAYVTQVATLGELAASLAHEINQPLGAVVNNASACVRWLSAQNLEAARQSAVRIIADGHRAGDIISRIRALARKAPPHKDWLDVNALIREVLALVRSDVQRYGVTLQMHLATDLPPVLGDRIQLQQVVLNLLDNALDALRGVPEGSREVQISSGILASQSVHVAVRDTGSGLTAESLEHLFDAFYTTKPEGMGLGLAISRRIIEAHGGQLWATPNTDPGATFQFTLPAGGEQVS